MSKLLVFVLIHAFSLSHVKAWGFSPPTEIEIPQADELKAAAKARAEEEGFSTDQLFEDSGSDLDLANAESAPALGPGSENPTAPEADTEKTEKEPESSFDIPYLPGAKFTGLGSSNPKVQLYGQEMTLEEAKQMAAVAMAAYVGKDGDEAAEEIQQENPDIKKVEIIRPGEASTADYREDRVRINVDENNKVVSAPQIG